MTTRRPGRSRAAARLFGLLLLAAGAAVVVTAPPRWVWWLALGALLLWAGMVLAGPSR